MSPVLRSAFLLAVFGAAALIVWGTFVPPQVLPAPAATAAPPAPAATAAPVAQVQVSPTVPPPIARGAVPFSLTLSDADLTRAAASSFPQTVIGVTVSDPDVRVQPGGVRLVAKAKVLFGTTQFVLQATPIVSNGRLAVRVDSATLAGIGVPDSTKASIAETLQRAIAPLVPANVRISSVTLVAGTLTVQGVQ